MTTQEVDRAMKRGDRQEAARRRLLQRRRVWIVQNLLFGAVLGFAVFENRRPVCFVARPDRIGLRLAHEICQGGNGLLDRRIPKVTDLRSVCLETHPVAQELFGSALRPISASGRIGAIPGANMLAYRVDMRKLRLGWFQSVCSECLPNLVRRRFQIPDTIYAATKPARGQDVARICSTDDVCRGRDFA